MSPASFLVLKSLPFPDFWIFAFFSYGSSGDFEPPELTTATAIGITVAIAGNVLISLALNIQKLAHRRVEISRTNSTSRRYTGEGTDARTARESRCMDANIGERNTAQLTEGNQLDRADSDEYEDVFRERSTPSRRLLETQRLLHTPSNSRRNYGASAGVDHTDRKHKPKRTFASIFIPLRLRSKLQAGNEFRDDDGPVPPLNPGSTTKVTSNGDLRRHDKRILYLEQESAEESESDYLKSKLWWFGFLLMNVGELGNFISYAFAPASVVAPLGTFALIANCFFAPLMQGERFRKVDLFGVLIAVIGAVTVVLSAKMSDVRLGPDALIHAISQHSFIIFSCVYIAGAAVLAALSEGEAGRNWVFVDVGLCALFGGFTVLSTKAVSTLLTMEWIEMFTKWITYPIILVLVLTGVCQIRYLNRALMRFDSKVVIPIQFVLFTLSAIIGSAVLYGDFKKATFHQLFTFLYGCVATFLGVFIIAWVPPNADEEIEEETLVDVGETPRTGSSSRGRGTADERSGFGSFSGRNRPVPLHPGARDMPSVRRRQSIISIGVSPAQHLLLVHTPPRDMPDRRVRDSDPERDTLNLRRTINWFDEETRRETGTM